MSAPQKRKNPAGSNKVAGPYKLKKLKRHQLKKKSGSENRDMKKKALLASSASNT